MHHDYFHALGFSRLSEEMFGLMQEASARALASDDEAEIGKVTELIDDLSANAAITSFSSIRAAVPIPREFINVKTFASVKKHQVEKRQLKLDQQIKSIL
jgi:hypothetical protein